MHVYVSVFMNICLLFQIFDYIYLFFNFLIIFKINREVLGEAFEKSLFPESSFAKKTYFFASCLFFNS